MRSEDPDFRLPASCSETSHVSILDAFGVLGNSQPQNYCLSTNHSTLPLLKMFHLYTVFFICHHLYSTPFSDLYKWLGHDLAPGLSRNTLSLICALVSEQTKPREAPVVFPLHQTPSPPLPFADLCASFRFQLKVTSSENPYLR